MRGIAARLVGALALVVVLGGAGSAFAKSGVGGGSFGAGVQLGFPGNGLSFNYFSGSSVSIQVDATLWLKDNWTGLGARVDLLWWQTPLARMNGADLLWYFGPGANLFSFSWSGDGPHDDDSYVGLGVEFPVGIGFRFTGVPIDLNLEGVPILRILGSDGTDIGFDIAGVLNARYYF